MWTLRWSEKSEERDRNPSAPQKLKKNNMENELKELTMTIIDIVEKYKERQELDSQKWVNLFKNNSKEEILELLINCKFPL